MSDFSLKGNKVCWAAFEGSSTLVTCVLFRRIHANKNVYPHISECVFAHINVCEGKSDCVGSSICLPMCAQRFACVHVCMCL